MAYLCVDKSGEYIADNEPTRNWFEWIGWAWEDEPYEMPLNMFCNGEL